MCAPPLGCSTHRRAALLGAVGLAGALAALGALAASGAGVERVEVTGGSMAPSLLPGDRLLLVRPRRGRSLRVGPGDVVRVPDPRDPSRQLVKRVRRVTGGAVEVRGDDPAWSTDSRHFGPVALADVRGRAVWRYAPPGRAGHIPAAGPAAPDPTGPDPRDPGGGQTGGGG